MTAPHPEAGLPPGRPAPVARLCRPPAPRGASASSSRIDLPDRPGAPAVLESIQGALALDLARTPSGPPPRELAAVPSRHRGDPAADTAVQVQAWAARFAQAVVEVTGGDRPVTQLLRWTAPRVYSDLDRRARVLAQTGTAVARRRSLRPQVASVHVFLPGPRSAEVSVHVRYGERSRAMAARLELRKGRWTCTDLRLG